MTVNHDVVGSSPTAGVRHLSIVIGVFYLYARDFILACYITCEKTKGFDRCGTKIFDKSKRWIGWWVYAK